MMRQITRTVMIWGAFLLSLPCAGQGAAADQLYRDSLHRHIWVEGSANLACRFNYDQGSSSILSSLPGNAMELARLDAFIRQALSHPDLFIERIYLTGYSSIEGNYYTNEQLSRNRVEGFQNYLRHHYPELQRYPHTIIWAAEDWDGLAKAVRGSTYINEWEEILEIIRKIRSYDEREALLKYLNGGRPYSLLEQTILPGLRRVEIRIEYGTTQPLSASVALPEEQTPSGTLPPTTPQPQQPWDSKAVDNWLGIGPVNHRSGSSSGSGSEALHPGLPADESPVNNNPEDENSTDIVETDIINSDNTDDQDMDSEALRPDSSPHPVWAIKTNALLWAGIQHDFKYTTSVANVALEYYVNDNLSIEIGAMYAYWRYNSNREFQGISGYRIEPRYNYPSVVSAGWIGGYLGLYGRIGDYDKSYTLEEGENTTLQEEGYTSDYWDAGLSAGLTITLVGQLALEVGARAGYVSTTATRYTPEGNYYWFESREKYNKFKVTDLNISLIYRFR